MTGSYGWRFWVYAILICLPAGMVGSLLLKRLVLLIPAVLHTLLMLLCLIAAGKKPGKGLIKRLWLAGFILLCIGFYLICRNAYVTIGIGFLIGLLPAMPLAWIAAREALKEHRRNVIFIWMPLSFAVYFWSSVLVMAIKGF